MTGYDQEATELSADLIRIDGQSGPRPRVGR